MNSWAPQAAGVPPQPGMQPQSPPPYGWNPPPAGGPPAAGHTAPGRPRVWLWALATVVLTVVAIAITAAVTYAIARAGSSTATSSADPAPPTYTAAEQADARQAVCNAFDATTANQQAQGGVIVDGQPNVPVMLRKSAGAVTIVQALVPATPETVTASARQYVTANLNLLNAALGQGSLDQIKNLTDSTNDATSALADACGLPK